VLFFVLAGALLGNLVATLLAPHYIEWNNSTPLATQMQCDLPKVVRTVSAELIHDQLIGTVGGAALFLVLGVAFLVSRARKQKAGTPPPSTPAPAAG
jgi:hypothetical protein